jgi:hypothetical protein
MTQSIPQTLPEAQTLQCVIAWLEGGCDPKLAAKELRLLADRPLAVAAIPEGAWINLGVTLPEPLLSFDDWLNAPPSREVPEPSEAHAYRFEAYHRWERAVKELRALAVSQPPAGQQDRGEAQEVRAWESDDGRVISAAQKATALRDGGASASSVKGYTRALVSGGDAAAQGAVK